MPPLTYRGDCAATGSQGIGVCGPYAVRATHLASLRAAGQRARDVVADGVDGPSPGEACGVLILIGVWRAWRVTESTGQHATPGQQ